MKKEQIEKILEASPTEYDFAKNIEAALLQEIYHALCFMCKGQGEPVRIANIWMHLHTGGDGKVYSKSECKNSPLREYFAQQERE